jgi:hypothetical protein
MGTRFDGQARLQANWRQTVLATERVYLIQDRQTGIGPDFVGPTDTRQKDHYAYT